MNQCDGCQAGMYKTPSGHHLNKEGRVEMCCTANRYKEPKPEVKPNEHNPS